MNSPIEEELEWEAEGSEIRRENTSELEREVEAERQMDLIEKEVQKQQKEEEIKEKFAKILFKNSLFYSSWEEPLVNILFSIFTIFFFIFLNIHISIRFDSNRIRIMILCKRN